MSARHTVGRLIRARRREQRLTLERLAALVGCAKSYLSSIENDRRGPPREEMLEKIEHALGLAPGALVRAAHWQSVPDLVHQEFAEFEHERRITRRLASILGEGGIDGSGRVVGMLDEAHRSGELRRLIERLHTPGEGDLPMDIPVLSAGGRGRGEDYVRVPGLSDPDAFGVRVMGDEMSPEYRAGDVVVFSPLGEARAGSDCLARFRSGREVFRRVYFDGEEGTVRLQPLNTEHPAEHARRDEIVSLVVGVSVVRAISAGA